MTGHDIQQSGGVARCARCLSTGDDLYKWCGSFLVGQPVTLPDAWWDRHARRFGGRQVVTVVECAGPLLVLTSIGNWCPVEWVESRVP